MAEGADSKMALVNDSAWIVLHHPRSESMTTTPQTPRRFVIRGVTRDGKTFRPSDWAERLAGAMSSFRPEGVRGGIGAFIGYSPYCVPQVMDGVKCVLVDEAVREVELLAWDFVMNFARDNQLQVMEIRPVQSSDEPS